jgi:hypothetical protein
MAFLIQILRSVALIAFHRRKMTFLLKTIFFARLVLAAVLLTACGSYASPTPTADPALALKESAFSALFPFEMNSTLSIREQAWEPPFKIKEPPNDIIGFLIVNNSRTPVWLQDDLLAVKIYSYGLSDPNTWTEIPNLLWEETPAPVVIGQPPFRVAEFTDISIASENLRPTVPLELRVVVVGRLASRQGQPTDKMVGAFIDITVIDERLPPATTNP